MSTREIFDQNYSDRNPLFGRVPTSIVTELVKLMQPPGRIIDLGCGDGRDALYLLSQGFNVVAVDFSMVGLANLRKEAESKNLSQYLEVIHADIGSWECPCDAVDAVIGITILDHLDCKVSEKVINRFKRVVKIGGYMCFEVHTDRDPASMSKLDRTVDVSEFGKLIQYFAPANWLLSRFSNDWRVCYYHDRIETDYDHGPVHNHGFASIITHKQEQ